MYLSRVLGGIPPTVVGVWEEGEEGEEGANGIRPWDFSTAGLEEYYHSLWPKMAGDGLSEIELEVLRVLVEQEKAVSVETIAQFIDVDEYDVEEVLESWLEFLHWQEIGGEICYSLYHWSFRDFLQLRV
ncbi:MULTISPECIES: Holliday junction DNA helicase RuvB C-terminal domain-containing protein [Okeania]|uniref:RuvB winged helix C-terminal domain-containing protein n=1 Tax=Okeania hirsuta TaxID=1458930 RepID=A0A3N6REE0_9CYAN|nr:MULTISPECIES: Holliday junction DNA helicase RuvB C-terminal domain-containing protein [Okeania]NET14839.1 hypothetical protein [Okeania sp. SIO1H6]NES78188.1 hypothetical protein [Okeania sp. SIO1H4]NES89952.1 hypothetical protein [Okeania sp. SIO2B9]NET18750.1 hypothetical protein [Okeania sp. SIO1H5]NET78337.1 hypothetical protein [Okeania sp. SIO1F9]